MRVIKAREMGLCFGVRDALDVAFRRQDAAEITIRGELVHNETVNEHLARRGFAMTSEARPELTPSTSKVLITAHGVSDRERARLAARGKELIDTTCPLVRRAHRAARQLAEAGYHVVVLGTPGHVEVRGLVGDLRSYDVVPSVDRVAYYPYPRIGVVCQTTCPEHTAREILETIELANPDAEVRFVDTVCEPTRQRTRAVEELAREADVVVVVGGRNSNNTKKLAALCEQSGRRTHHVQSVADLDPAWFAGCEVIGLTAGTSTLDATVDDVYAALCRIAEQHDRAAEPRARVIARAQ